MERVSQIRHLSILFLISRHAHPDNRREAEAILAKYPNVSYYTGFEDVQTATPQSDWNRISHFTLRSFKSVESGLQTLGDAQKVMSKKHVAELLRDVDEMEGDAKVKKLASNKKKADGKKRNKYVKLWVDTVAKARKALCLAKNEHAQKRYIFFVV